MYSCLTNHQHLLQGRSSNFVDGKKIKKQIIFPDKADPLICFEISEFISSFQCSLILEKTAKSTDDCLSNFFLSF